MRCSCKIVITDLISNDAQEEFFTSHSDALKFYYGLRDEGVPIEALAVHTEDDVTTSFELMYLTNKD